MLAKAWPATFDARSNSHCGLHMPELQNLFGIKVASAARQETNHGRHRAVNTNHQDPELAMMKASAVNDMIAFLGSCDASLHLCGVTQFLGTGLKKMLAGDKFVQMLMTGLQEANTYAQGGVARQDQQILQETIVGKKSRRRVLPVPEAFELRKAYQSEHPDI